LMRMLRLDRGDADASKDAHCEPSW
jgi:hypothetical protein